MKGFHFVGEVHLQLSSTGYIQENNKVHKKSQDVSKVTEHLLE